MQCGAPSMAQLCCNRVRTARNQTQKETDREPQLSSEQGVLAPRTCRIAAFLRGARPRGLIFPYENARILLRESSTGQRSDDKAEKRERREERREKMGTSSIPCISTVSRGHLKEVMKIRWEHRKCRKLESLQFYGVP